MSTEAESKPEKGKRIHIVEDDQFLREIAIEKFKNEGYEVTGVSNGDGLIEKLENDKPDLLILDLVLEGKSGFDILESVHKDDKLKDLPILVLSNLGADSDIKRAKELGARDYMVKAHFTFAEILKKIEEVLSGH